MYIDIQGYKILYNNRIYNGVAIDGIYFGEDYEFTLEDPEKYGTRAPESIALYATNSDCTLELITDRVEKIQFIPALKA